jgi:hypothetical protein
MRLILIVVINIIFSAFLQAQGFKKSIVVNFQPMVFLEPLTGLKVGGEYRLANNLAVASDVAYRFGNNIIYIEPIQDGESQTAKGIQIQPEIKYFLASTEKVKKGEVKKRQNNFYVSMRFGYAQYNDSRNLWTFINNQNAGSTTPAVQQLINYKRKKVNLDCSFNLGLQLFSKTKNVPLGAELFTGFGFRRKKLSYSSTTSGVTNEFARNRFNDDISSNSENVQLLPILQFGLKMVYRIK